MTLSCSEEGGCPESSQWVVLGCVCVVASGTVLAGFARMSSSFDANLGPLRAPSGHIDLEIGQQVAAQLRIVLDMTRNGIGWLSARPGTRSETPRRHELVEFVVGADFLDVAPPLSYVTFRPLKPGQVRPRSELYKLYSSV